MNWYHPIGEPAPITQTFYQHPYYGKGVDFGVPNGTPIYALRSGRVAQVTDLYKINQTGDQYGYGNRIILDHGQLDGAGWVSYYAHLSPGIPVQVGDMIYTSQLIAYSDNNGSSTGPHLHCEVRRNNTPVDWWPGVVFDPQLVDGGNVGFNEPVYPDPVRVTITARPFLNIRNRPSITGRDVGDLPTDTVVSVIDGTWVGNDYWMRIGHDQYIAAYHKGIHYITIDDEP